MTNQPRPMGPRDIYAELTRRGESASSVSRRAGVSDNTVMSTIHGRAKNRKALDELANTLGMSIREIFGYEVEA